MDSIYDRHMRAMIATCAASLSVPRSMAQQREDSVRVFFIAFGAILTGSFTAHAQSESTVEALLDAGFEVKAAYGVPSYSQNAILYLQRGTELYVCSIAAGQGGLLRGGDVARGQCSKV
jgi:hypothetical protein